MFRIYKWNLIETDKKSEEKKITMNLQYGLIIRFIETRKINLDI